MLRKLLFLFIVFISCLMIIEINTYAQSTATGNVGIDFYRSPGEVEPPTTGGGGPGGPNRDRQPHYGPNATTVSDKSVPGPDVVTILDPGIPERDLLGKLPETGGHSLVAYIVFLTGFTLVMTGATTKAQEDIGLEYSQQNDQ